MRLSFIAALAAATALVPAAASAQNHDRGSWHGDGDGGQRDGGQRGDRGQRGDARPAPAPAPRPAAAPQGRPNFQPGARPGGFDRGAMGRPDRPQGFQRPDQSQGFARPQGFQRPDRPQGADRPDRGQGFRPDAARDFPARRAPGFDGSRPDGSYHVEAGGSHAGDRDGRRGWTGDRSGNPGWNGGDRDGHRDGQWNRGRDDHSGAFTQDHRGDRNGWNGDRNGWHGDRNGWRGDNRGGFSRDWRGDRRYDWRNYRTTNRNVYHLPRYYAPYGWDRGYRRFGVGFTLDSILFGSNYWISDPYYYRLPPAYGPYRWVRYYDDALLVDIRTGSVVDVVYDIFW